MNEPSTSSSADDPRPAPPRVYRAIQRLEAPVMNAMGLSCREFARLTVARIDRPLTANESLRLRLHGAMCGICARFSRQFSAIGRLLGDIETESPPVLRAEPESFAADRVKNAVRRAVADADGRDDSRGA